jgi:hypothetical protein
MERIGMSHSPADNFEHPGIPEGHPLRRHVLYRVLQYQGSNGEYVRVLKYRGKTGYGDGDRLAVID